jgi:hypothetical protein
MDKKMIMYVNQIFEEPRSGSIFIAVGETHGQQEDNVRQSNFVEPRSGSIFIAVGETHVQ